MRVLLERRCDVPDRRCSRIHDLAGSSLDGRKISRTIAHAAVRERRPVVDDDYPLASHRVGCIQGNDRCAADDLGFGSESTGGLGDPLNVGRRRRVGLGDDDDVGHAQDSLARVMGGLVSRPQRIDENDVEAWSDERKVVVAAIPQNDIRFFLGSLEDAGIVGTGKHQIADGEMRLILLALFDGALCGIEVGQVLGSAARPGVPGCHRASDGGRRQREGRDL